MLRTARNPSLGAEGGQGWIGIFSKFFSRGEGVCQSGKGRYAFNSMLNMPVISLAFGGLMIALGVGGWAITGMEHATALIPAGFGLILEICGVIALVKPSTLKHVMHAAVMVALLGLLGTARAFTKLGAALDGTAERPAAVYSQLAMAVLCLVFLGFCVKSFIDARRARQAAQS